MKKIFILLAITVMAVNVNAQWFIGGKIGLNVKNSHTIMDENPNATISTTSTGFSIAPKGGYYFNEKFALGLGFSVGANFKNVSNENDYPEYQISKSQGITVPWRINPFVRYSVFTYKKFSLILEGSVGIGGEQYKEDNTHLYNFKRYQKRNILGIGVLNITPILGFKLSDHFQLEAGLNFLNLGYNIDIINSLDKITNEVGVESSYKTKTINHDFNIGFNSSSILVVSQLTIGVIYKF